MELVRPDPFLEACGASAWRCAVARGAGARPADDAARVLGQPYLVVGRRTGADVRLDDQSVNRRHAYFQLLGGRIFGIDLGSRTGTWLGGQPFHAGWVPAGRALGIGPFTLRFGVLGATNAEAAGELDPLRGPLGNAATTLPPVRLEIAVTGARPRVCRMNVALVLIGSGPMCRLRLRDNRIEAAHCSLVRTAHGLWAVDLLTDWGIVHNGYLVRSCRLAPGDRLGVGPYAIRVLEAATAEPAVSAEVVQVPAVLAPAPSVPAVAWPAEALGRLESIERRQEAMQDQFQQTMLMLLQALGRMHHDQMQTVSAELAEVGRLTQAIDGLRAELRARAAEPPGARPEPETEPEAEQPRVRRDPREVHAVVSERLAAFERERQSRWNRILRTLGGAS